jgi:hypothetical protein
MNIGKLTALRRAGFPLPQVSEILERFGLITELEESKIPEMFPTAHQIAGKWYLEPTIEQLLEALGQKFRLLERVGAEKPNWTAMNKDKIGYGADPKEALANLYLEVKK